MFINYLGSASANAYSSSGTGFIGNEGHKGIRSYDTSGGHNQPNGGGGHQDGGCKWSKCKWENDDYWEKEEEETEPEEEDEDECYDNGQYKVHDHRHKSKGGPPPGVQKLGAPNPFTGQQSQYTGGGAPFGTVTPISGHSQTTASTQGSQQPFNQQSGSTNQRYDGPTPGTGLHPVAAPGSWLNADVSTDKNGPKTGFGCAGNYQRETGCAQG